MGWIEPFWAGAQRWAQGVDVGALAARAGGFDALKAVSLADLVRLGVPGAVAIRWLGEPGYETRGWAWTLADDAYPSRLRDVPHAPPVLFCEGDAAAFSAPVSVAIVGTRLCTESGRALARHLGGLLAHRGALVVSGLANGIDAAAHRGAVAQGRTVGVLAVGLGPAAARGNRRLRQEMVDGGGAVLTTWPDDTEPRPWRFPLRNRWIAALADAVVVVEAGEQSGARHTALAALELGRDLWAVPGRVADPASRGCLALLGEGANPLYDLDRFVDDLLGTGKRERPDWLVAVLQGCTVDEASARSRIPVAELLRRLAVLEVEGAVVRLPGQRYAAA